MLDFMICALTNLFRIFLIGRCASIFLGVDVDKKKKHLSLIHISEPTRH